MFEGNDDSFLASVLKYQGFSFMFSTVLEAGDGHISFADEDVRETLLHEMRLPQESFARFLPVVLPEKREGEEVAASGLLSGDELNQLLASTLCHPEEDPCDWVLYEVYKRKVRTFNFEEGRRVETIKLKRFRGCLISEDESGKDGVVSDLRIYAILKNVDRDGSSARVYSPVVNLFATVEKVKESEAVDSALLLPTDFSHMRVRELNSSQSVSLRELMLNTLEERFISIAGGTGRHAALRKGKMPFAGRLYRTCCLSVDSFARFSPDPLLAYARGIKTDRKQLSFVLYLLNLLYADYDTFERVDGKLYTPEFLEERIMTLLRNCETSTSTYSAPGCTVTVDDFGDDEVRSHIAGTFAGEASGFDYDLGGPRNELIYHTLILSTVSSRSTILKHYERAILASLHLDGSGISRAGSIKTIVEKAVYEFSLQTFGPFQSPALEREFDEISEINSGNSLMEQFQRDVDFYGKYAVEEEHHKLMVDQSRMLNEEEHLLGELKGVLRDMNRSLARTEVLTYALIILSAISVIVALLFSLRIV